MKKPDLTRFVPPGVELSPLRAAAACLTGIAAFITLCVFSTRLSRWLDALTYQTAMVDFCVVLGGALIPFFLLALCELAFLLYFYLTFFQGSKSIYLMRRLPRRELARRCLALPVSAAASTLLAAFAMLLICYAIYMVKVPDESLTPHQWQKLWRSIL